MASISMGYESESGQEVDLTIRHRQPFKGATVAGLLTLLVLSCTALYFADFKTDAHAPTRTSFIDTIQESEASGMVVESGGNGGSQTSTSSPPYADMIKHTQDTINFNNKVLESQKNVAGLLEDPDNANDTEILKKLSAELGMMAQGNLQHMIQGSAKTMQDRFDSRLSTLSDQKQQLQAAGAPLPPAPLQQQLLAAGAPPLQAPAAAVSTSA